MRGLPLAHVQAAGGVQQASTESTARKLCLGPVSPVILEHTKLPRVRKNVRIAAHDVQLARLP